MPAPNYLWPPQCGPMVMLYTGSFCLEDNVWEAATSAAGDYYLENAGDTHRTLDRLAQVDPTGLSGATSTALGLLEGEVLNAAVKQQGRIAVGPQVPNINLPIAGQNIPLGALPPQAFGPVNRAPAQNPGQQVTEFIHDYGPAILIAAAAIQLASEGNGDDDSEGDAAKKRVFHGTDDESAGSINGKGLNKADWEEAAGGAGTDPKGFSVTTDRDTAQAWAEVRAAERGGKPVVLEADPDALPLRPGRPGEWADPDELFIEPDDFPCVGPGTFAPSGG